MKFFFVKAIPGEKLEKLQILHAEEEPTGGLWLLSEKALTEKQQTHSKMVPGTKC